jgi:hypothetical protein
MELIDIFRILQPSPVKYTSFSRTHSNFSRIQLILDHNASLNKYTNNEIIYCTLTDYNGKKLELSKKKNYKNKHMEFEQYIFARSVVP